MVGSQIIFPDTLYTIDDDQMKRTIIPRGKNRIIIWFDSTGCSACKALDLYNFDFVYDYCHDSLDMGCEFVAVFSPTKKQLNDLAVLLWEKNMNIPFVIDVNNDFFALNSFIPSSNIFHSFLLNESNEIMLVGRPNYNTKMWNLYKSCINKR